MRPARRCPPVGPLHSQSERLARRLSVEQAWAQYLVNGAFPAEVRDVISSSWHRARDSYRLDPASLNPGGMETMEALLARRQRDDIYALVAPVLRDFVGYLDLSDHVLSYFDRDGWMLSIDGDQETIERLEAISFRPGTNWSEASAGTNGPGTALAEGRPVEVFASEHFVAAWQQWSCAAAPIRLSGSVEPVGILDLTGRSRIKTLGLPVLRSTVTKR